MTHRHTVEPSFSMQQPLSRASFLRWTGAAVLGATLPATVSRAVAGEPATAGQTVRVDLRHPLAEPTYRATGFLHGLSNDGSQPADELLRPLKAQLFRGGGSTVPGGGWSVGGLDGYRARWAVTRDQFERVCRGPFNAEYCIVISDLWGAEGVSLEPTDPYPGDDGDWTSWEQFLTQIVADARAAGMRNNQVQYEIWNEPDFGNVYFPRPKAQYEEMWRRGVRLLRQLNPRARIVGPTFTRITVTENSWHMDDWLDMVTESDTAPDILAWHDLIPGRDPVDQADLARDLLAERGLDHVQLELNEYPSSGGLDPGYNSWYVARLERSGIDYAVLAIFGSCCGFPELDGLLTNENGELVRNGRWWTYQRYADITGTLVAAQPDSAVDAVAGYDRSRGQARVLLGNEFGDGRDLGTVRVTFDGEPALRRLSTGGHVPVRIERVADRAKLTQPEVVQDFTAAMKDRRLDVDIPWQDASSAYVVTLGNQDSELPPYVIVEVTPAEPVLLPDEPTPVVFRLRNYTDDTLTVPVATTIPNGYTADAPSTIDVPPNGDAELTVVVTRTASGSPDDQLVITVGDESVTVALQASDNWARIATMSASSTHPPSSPANLNDGDTNPERWGGGGAGGWNDGTLGAFPDVVTATWSHPVTLSKVRVHTLDSEAYPAPQWGVRDFDVTLVTAGARRTVAQVRGNQAGVVEQTFPAAAADALEITILASNSGDYSRLIEVEAFS